MMENQNRAFNRTGNFGGFGTAAPDNDPNPTTFEIGSTITITPEDEPVHYDLLPEGTYSFGVSAVDAESYAGGAKLPACSMLVVTLNVQGADGKTGRCKNRLFLCKKMIKSLVGFYRSIGVLTGNTLTITADICGAVGRGHFSHREYNGKTYLQLDYCVDHDTDEPVIDKQDAGEKKEDLPF